MRIVSSVVGSCFSSEKGAGHKPANTGKPEGLPPRAFTTSSTLTWAFTSALAIQLASSAALWAVGTAPTSTISTSAAVPLDVGPEPGGGTTFMMTLRTSPLASDADSAALPESSSSPKYLRDAPQDARHKHEQRNSRPMS